MQILARLGDDLRTAVGIFVALVGLTVASAFGLVVWSVVALVAGDTGFVLDLLLLALLAGVVAGGTAAVLSFLALCYGVWVRVSTALRRSGARIQRRAEALERRNLLFRLVGLSDVVASLDPRSPRTRAEDRVDLLKHEYVSGTLTERAFERRVGEVLGASGHEDDPGSSVDDRVRRLQAAEWRRADVDHAARPDGRHRGREPDV